MKKEKTVNDDRITYRQLGQPTDGRDRPAANAIENAAPGVNAAERAIRQTAAMIRAKLAEIEQRPGHGLSLNDLGELQRMAAGLDRAGGGQAAAGRAAAIGAAHGRDAARRALARATPAACRDITARLEAADPMVYDLYATPALSGQHGIRHDTVDLAGDLDPALADDSILRGAEEAYFTAAGEAFGAEAERIARDRAAQHPQPSTRRSQA
jgi:hypothetical protein